MSNNYFGQLNTLGQIQNDTIQLGGLDPSKTGTIEIVGIGGRDISINGFIPEAGGGGAGSTLPLTGTGDITSANCNINITGSIQNIGDTQTNNLTVANAITCIQDITSSTGDIICNGATKGFKALNGTSLLKEVQTENCKVTDTTDELSLLPKIITLKNIAIPTDDNIEIRPESLILNKGNSVPNGTNYVSVNQIANNLNTITEFNTTGTQELSTNTSTAIGSLITNRVNFNSLETKADEMLINFDQTGNEFLSLKYNNVQLQSAGGEIKINTNTVISDNIISLSSTAQDAANIQKVEISNNKIDFTTGTDPSLPTPQLIIRNQDIIASFMWFSSVWVATETRALPIWDSSVTGGNGSLRYRFWGISGRSTFNRYMNGVEIPNSGIEFQDIGYGGAVSSGATRASYQLSCQFGRATEGFEVPSGNTAGVTLPAPNTAYKTWKDLSLTASNIMVQRFGLNGATTNEDTASQYEYPMDASFTQSPTNMNGTQTTAYNGRNGIANVRDVDFMAHLGSVATPPVFTRLLDRPNLPNSQFSLIYQRLANATGTPSGYGRFNITFPICYTSDVTVNVPITYIVRPTNALL